MFGIRTAIVAASLTLACGAAMGGPQNDRPIVPTGSYDQDQAQNPYDQDQNQAQQQQQDTDNDTAVESFGYVAGKSHLGVLVMQLTSDLRTYFGAPTDRGVIVAKVEPRSAAQRAGIRVGDVIVDVADQPVASADDVIGALSSRTGERLDLTVIRQGQERTLVARLPSHKKHVPQHDEDTDSAL